MSTYFEIINGKVLSLQNEAEMLLKCGQARECIKIIGRALVLDSHNAFLHYLRGEAFLSLENYSSAIKSIAKALRIEPFSRKFQERLAVTYGCYGDSLYKENKFLQALVNYKFANGILPSYISKCISCHIHLKEYDNALVMLDYTLHQELSVELLVTRAKLYLLFGKATKCYDDVHAALKINPLCQDALNLKNDLEDQTAKAKKKAFGYCLSQKQKDALKQMNIAVDSDPYNAKHHILRGILHRQSNSFNQAVDDFLFAMDKCGHSYENPLYEEASRELVLTFNSFAVECFKKECYSEAVCLLDKAIKHEKRSFALYVNRGDCYFKLCYYSFALGDYQQALDLIDGCYSGLSYRLAVTHFTLGINDFSVKQLQSAEEHFSAAIFYSPYTPCFFVCRARIESLQKKIPQAENDIINALLLDQNCENCLSLVNQLFPGCSVKDLLCSERAQSVRYSIQCQSQVQESVYKWRSKYEKKSLSSTKQTVLDQMSSWEFDPLSSQESTDSIFCIDENDFNIFIYYTKKKYTDHLRKILNCHSL